MTNEEKLKALKMWQEAGYVHEYTCTCSDSPAMTPVEKNGEVVLICPVCKTVQNWALDTAYEYYKNGDHEKMRTFLGKL